MDTVGIISVRSDIPAEMRRGPRLRWLPVLAAFVVALAPLSLLIWNQDWFFTQVGWIDPWHYVWFFQFYTDPNFWPGAYKLARLPWVLSGWVAFHLLPPVAAAYALHGAYLVLAAGAMFATVYLAFGDLLVALAAALLLGFLPSFHGSGGWDYHNTAAGAFYLVTTALLQWAIVTPARRGLAMVLFGAGCALTVHSNITFINFLPVLGFHYCASVWYTERRAGGTATYLKPFIYATVVAVSVTALLCAINVAVGRNRLFFYALVRIVFNFTRDTRLQAPFWEPWSTLWFLRPSSGYLAVPATALVTGAVTLFGKFIRRSAVPLTASRLTALLFVGEAVFLAILWIMWQAQGQTALNWRYFAYPLIPPSLFAFAGMLFLASKRFSWRMSVLLAVVGWGALSCGLAAGAHSWIVDLLPSSQNWWPVATAVLLLAAFAVHFVLGGGIVGWLAFFALFALGNDAVTFRPASYQAGATCRVAAAEYQTVVNGMRAIAAADPGFQEARIWADEKEQVTVSPGCQVPAAYFAYSFGGSSWADYAGGRPFPPIGTISVGDLTGNGRGGALLIVPTNRLETVEALEEKFRDAGAEVTIEDIAIGEGPVALQLYIIKMRRP